MSNLWQDVRFAARMLAKDRRFTIAAVIALALGIGVNSSVFGIINAAILKDVPFERPERLISIRTVDASGRQAGVSYPDLQDLIAQTTAFEALAADSAGPVNVSGEDLAPERFRGAYISASTFRVLRATPILGRAFLPDDDRAGAPAVAILGHGVWLRRYGGDPSVIGRTIKVNDVPSVIVGVMPEGFSYPHIVEIWQPLALAPGLSTATRGARTLGVVGRLSDGADLAGARTNVEAVASQLAAAYPQTNKDLRVLVRLLKDTRPDSTAILLTLMAAVGFVLLIACANLANLMLARSASRSREIAVRIALGASRWRVVRQLLIESLLLAAVATVFGLVLSVYGTSYIAIGFNAIEAGVPLEQTKPYWIDVTMDSVVYVFLGGICLFTSLAFGLIPALQISRSNANEVLRDGRSGSGMRGRRWTTALMVAEVALTMILLTGSGLIWRNFLDLYDTDTVIEPSQYVTMQLGLPIQKYATPDQRRQFLTQLDERLASLPAFSSAAMSSHVPLIAFSGPPRQISIEGRTAASGEAAQSVSSVMTGPRYFDTLGLEMLRGRSLTTVDGEQGRESVVVNEQMAAMFFPGEDPLGRRIQLAGATPASPPTPWLTIVGVSPTLPSLGPARPRDLSEPVVYVPFGAEPAPRFVSLTARSGAGLAATVAAIRDHVRALDPDLPLFGIESLDVGLARSNNTFAATLFTVFALIALVVAGVGLYAITWHGVAQRTHEIGVRIALGASARDVMWLFLRRTGLQLAVGASLGLVGSLAVGGPLQFFLGRISPRDPLTLVVVLGLLLAIGLVASALPARRASLVDPAVALRAE